MKLKVVCELYGGPLDGKKVRKTWKQPCLALFIPHLDRQLTYRLKPGDDTTKKYTPSGKPYISIHYYFEGYFT